MHWYGLKVFSVYETTTPPVEEFIDDGFIEEWRGVEISSWLVVASSADHAGEIVNECCSAPWINIYGQSVSHRVLSLEVQNVGLWEFEPGEEESSVEVFSELWNITPSQDPTRFLEDPRPAPPDKCPMIDPISLYEHKSRYEELRGPLPTPD